MAHEHNAKCHELHQMLEALSVQRGIGRPVVSGASVSLPLSDGPTFADAGPGGANLELEIANVRRALQVMGCSHGG